MCCTESICCPSSALSTLPFRVCHFGEGPCLSKLLSDLLCLTMPCTDRVVPNISNGPLHLPLLLALLPPVLSSHLTYPHCSLPPAWASSCPWSIHGSKVPGFSTSTSSFRHSIIPPGPVRSLTLATSLSGHRLPFLTLLPPGPCLLYHTLPVFKD